MARSHSFVRLVTSFLSGNSGAEFLTQFSHCDRLAVPVPSTFGPSEFSTQSQAVQEEGTSTVYQIRYELKSSTAILHRRTTLRAICGTSEAASAALTRLSFFSFFFSSRLFLTFFQRLCNVPRKKHFGALDAKRLQTDI